MKLRLSELRQIIREELESASVVIESAEDEAQFQKIMAMITTSLGQTPEVDRLGADLKRAIAGKKKDDPNTLSMTSIAKPQSTSPEPGQTISMRSIK